MNLAISLQYVCILYEQMSVKDRLNEIKSLKLMSIKLFAETTNLSYRTAQNYLSGDREPNLEGLIKICTHLGINLN
ncbi:helix-turn-helix domain-containing protein [Simonsiella muelleri]|uniref:helix-turn-helix domain-containing protein n=1 Tax=Simonsiella muelleri TaxID=72 RepID=UPI0036F39C4E